MRQRNTSKGRPQEPVSRNATNTARTLQFGILSVRASIAAIASVSGTMTAVATSSAASDSMASVLDLALEAGETARGSIVVLRMRIDGRGEQAARDVRAFVAQ